jgi:hypothetical protein
MGGKKWVAYREGNDAPEERSDAKHDEEVLVEEGGDLKGEGKEPDDRDDDAQVRMALAGKVGLPPEQVRGTQQREAHGQVD